MFKNKFNRNIVDINEVSKEEISFSDDLIDIEQNKEIILPRSDTNNIDTIDDNKWTHFIDNKKEKINKINKFKETLKNRYNYFFIKIKNYFEAKYWRNKVDLLLFEIRDSAFLIVVLVLSLLSVIFTYNIYANKSDFNIISKYYEIQNSLRLENEKLRANQDMEIFAEALRFWVKQDSNEYYPYWWYLYNFDELFPKNIWDLNILTFIEWWSSEFIDYEWRKIRIDSEIIESFKKQNNTIDNWLIKWFPFDIKLKWEPKKVNDFLYNLKYNNKIPKDFRKITKKYNPESNLLETELDIVFYISK